MRRALIAKIKIAQKELGLDDVTYRAVLERVTGKRSCTECSIPELERVVEDLVDRVEWLSDGNMHKLVAALQIAANRKKKEA